MATMPGSEENKQKRPVPFFRLANASVTFMLTQYLDSPSMCKSSTDDPIGHSGNGACCVCLLAFRVTNHI